MDRKVEWNTELGDQRFEHAVQAQRVVHVNASYTKLSENARKLRELAWHPKTHLQRDIPRNERYVNVVSPVRSQHKTMFGPAEMIGEVGNMSIRAAPLAVRDEKRHRTLGCAKQGDGDGVA